jgi:plastocyanin
MAPVVVLASVNAFHVVGAIFAVWAVTVTALGVRRDDFPRAGAQTVAVGAISVLLAAGSIGSAIAVGILESNEEGKGESAAAKTPPGGGAGALQLSADPTQLRFDKNALQTNAGTVTIAMRNPAPVPHDIAVEGHRVDEKGGIVKGGATSTVRVRLEHGTYTFYCSVDAHRQAGMRGTLTVR